MSASVFEASGSFTRFKRFSSCSTLTRWSTSVVQVQLFSSAVVEKTAELPQLQFLVVWTGCCMPVGVQRLVVDVLVRLSTWGPRQYLDKVVDMPFGVSGKLWFICSCRSSARSWRRGLMSCGVDFLGPCTHRNRAGSHRDTAPIIRCICDGRWTNTSHQLHRPHQHHHHHHTPTPTPHSTPPHTTHHHHHFWLRFLLLSLFNA